MIITVSEYGDIFKNYLRPMVGLNTRDESILAKIKPYGVEVERE